MAVTWLHISDFHIREGDPYDRDVVTKALISSVARLKSEGRSPDLIFATGDIANSGKSAEYALATTFFDDLLAATGCPKNRLFVIPGNHDVDRGPCVALKRTLETREESDTYFRGNTALFHLQFKMQAFLEWHNKYFDGIRAYSPNTTCGPTERVEVNGGTLGILPINSALFCQGDDDHDKLWIGRRCLDAAVTDLRALGCQLNVALVHHPLDWLSNVEGANIRAALQGAVDFVLRGHLHETDLEMVTAANGTCLRCAAGAVYQTRRWPNRAMYATLDGDRVSFFPIRYEDNPTEVWVIDPSVFPLDPGHQKVFPIPRLAGSPAEPVKRTPGTAAGAAPALAASPPPRFRSNVTSRRDLPFVGRDSELAEIAQVLGEATAERTLVLHGQPGVGKSELAREFSRLHRERYPGGTFFINAALGGTPIDLALIGKNILGLDFADDLPLDDQCLQSLMALGSAPTLLIYDNVPEVTAIKPWLPPAGMPCHVLITTVLDLWYDGWRTLEVKPLGDDDSLELIRQLAGIEVASRFGDDVTKMAGGLPVQICPTASSLAYAQRRGRLNDVDSLADAAKASFEFACSRLEVGARLLLRTAAFLNCQQIPQKELAKHLAEGAGWSKNDFQLQVDACRDLHLLEGENDLRMHQLLAKFVLSPDFNREQPLHLRPIRETQMGMYLNLAQDLKLNPANAEAVSQFLMYPLTPADWSSAEMEIPIAGGKVIGIALYEIGRFDEAMPWFKRAVTDAERGGRGAIDHQSLGDSLHAVGYCLSGVGRFDEAKPWYERAVSELELGDVAGRIDHHGIARGLHQVGYCLSQAGKFGEAKDWFERAVKEEEKGDVNGKIDYRSLGRSLNQMGSCLSRARKFEEARPWFERAVEVKRLGDLHGRIDHHTIGTSLHQVGICLSRTGRFNEAKNWFERAVEAKQFGDIHGRIDHGNLGNSLHEVGYCLLGLGKSDEAKLWFERAVTETEKGDVHGRVSHHGLGRSLHQVGSCLSRAGKPDEAKSWFKRAVTEAEQGDVHGRVDHASVRISIHSLVKCLRQLGQTAEAQEWENRAAAMPE